MIAIDFILFTIVSAVNAYLPLFLRLKDFSATQIGFLFGVFNTAGIVVPFLLTPMTNRNGRLWEWLLFSCIVMAVSPFMIFGLNGFLATAAAMALFAGFYKYAIPLTDSLITQSLGEHQEKYGMIRMTGTAGFIVMSLVMQRFVHLENIGWKEMGLWYAAPATGLSLLVLGYVIAGGRKKSGVDEVYSPAEGAVPVESSETTVEEGVVPSEESDPSTVKLLKSFGWEFYLMLFVMFMQYLGMVPANQFLSLYANESLGADISGLLWAINSIFELPFMFLSGWFIKRYGARKIILVCTFAVSVRLLIYAFVQNVAGCILGQSLHSLTFGLYFPACVAYCTQKSQFHKSARILSFSLLNGVTGLPVVIGASIGGVIIDAFGYRMLFILFSIIPAVACIVYFAVKGYLNDRQP